jgi:hypothetical protein
MECAAENIFNIEQQVGICRHCHRFFKQTHLSSSFNNTYEAMKMSAIVEYVAEH